MTRTSLVTLTVILVSHYTSVMCLAQTKILPMLVNLVPVLEALCTAVPRVDRTGRWGEEGNREAEQGGW